MGKPAYLRLVSAGTFFLLALAATLAWAEKIEAESKKVVAPTAEEIKKGKMLFVKATCWGCHPRGDNSMNGDKPLKGPRFSKKYQSDEVLMATIRRGSISRGMPPFPPEKLSDQDLKQIVVFVRSLSCSVPVSSNKP